MTEFCFDCEMISEKFREVSGNKYCEECWFERFYTMENVICSECELEDIEGGELDIYETEEDGWICRDCRYDNRVSYYDIQKAKEQMSKLYKELGIGGE